MASIDDLAAQAAGLHMDILEKLVHVLPTAERLELRHRLLSLAVGIAEPEALPAEAAPSMPGPLEALIGTAAEAMHKAEANRTAGDYTSRTVILDGPGAFTEDQMLEELEKQVRAGREIRIVEGQGNMASSIEIHVGGNNGDEPTVHSALTLNAALQMAVTSMKDEREQEE